MLNISSSKVILQWGYRHTKISNTWHTIIFPQSFRNADYSCVVCPTADDSASKGAIAVASGYGTKTKGVGTILIGTDTVWADCNWVAMGLYT